MDVLENAGVVATLAGGEYGYADGSFTAARFRSPHGMAIDAAGNLYVADTRNRCLRKLTPSGQVTTLAGGPELETFVEPYGVAVDAGGHVFVSDTNRQAIYRVEPDGAVSLMAGGNGPGHADGDGASARFDDPRGLAVDPGGHVYVADMNNHRIRKISPAGNVSTLAGSQSAGHADGAGGAASFTSPIGVAVDPDGNACVVDIGTHSVRRIAPDGQVTTLAGSGAPGDADGVGAAAQFHSPWAIAADRRGALYVLDGAQGTRIRRLFPDQRVSTLAGSAEAGYRNDVGATARFFSAFAIAADSCGRLFVTDGFSRIRQVQ